MGGARKATVTLFILAAICATHASIGRGDEESVESRTRPESVRVPVEVPARLDVTELLQTYSRTESKARIGGGGWMFGFPDMSSWLWGGGPDEKDEDVKFSECKFKKKIKPPALPLEVETQVRKDYPIFIDIEEVAIGLKKVIVETADASVLYFHKGGKMEVAAMNRLLHDSVHPDEEGDFPKHALKCDDLGKVAVQLKLEDLLIVFNEGAEKLALVRNVIGNELKLDRLTVTAEVALQAFGEYDHAASAAMGRPIFKVRDYDENDAENQFSFCMGDLVLDELESDSTLASWAPTVLPYIKRLIVGAAGEEIKCAIRNKQPPFIDLVHTADSNDYWLGVEGHVSGKQKNMGISLDGFAEVYTKLPTKDVVARILEEANAQADGLKEESLHPTDISDVEELINRGDLTSLNQEQLLRYLRRHVNDVLDSMKMDAAEAASILDYVADRFFDKTSNVHADINKFAMHILNTSGNREGLEVGLEVGAGEVAFTGGEGWLPVGLLMKKQVMNKKINEGKIRCDAMADIAVMNGGNKEEFMEHCMNLVASDAAKIVPNSRELKDREKFSMGGDMFMNVANWHLRGPLDDEFWEDLIASSCSESSSGRLCLQMLDFIRTFLSSNLMGVQVFSGDNNKRSYSKNRVDPQGIILNKENIHIHAGLRYEGDLLLNSVLAAGLNTKQFLVARLKKSGKLHQWDDISNLVNEQIKISNAMKHDEQDCPPCDRWETEGTTVRGKSSELAKLADVPFASPEKLHQD